MAISKWSTTPASNATVTDGTYGNINWAEGQNTNTVNDSSRSEMAHVRAWYEDATWINLGDTATRASNTTFTVSGDVTSQYHAGRRIRIADSSTLYGRIVSSSYSAPNTTVTVGIDGGTALSTSMNGETVSFGTPANNPSTPVYGIPASQGVLAPHKNLVVKNNATNPAYQVDVDADNILITDGTTLHWVSSVNITADITASGANGLDTGVEANSTWYHIWVISNGTTTAGLLSTAAAIGSVTLPSGYTYYAYVGAIYNGSGGDFPTTYQRNDRVIRAAYSNSLTTSATVTALDISAQVPTTAVSADILTSAVGSSTLRVMPLNDTGKTDLAGVTYFSDNSGDSENANVMIAVSQTLYYYAGGAGTATLFTVGWRY